MARHRDKLSADEVLRRLGDRERAYMAGRVMPSLDPQRQFDPARVPDAAQFVAALRMERAATRMSAYLDSRPMPAFDEERLEEVLAAEEPRSIGARIAAFGQRVSEGMAALFNSIPRPIAVGGLCGIIAIAVAGSWFALAPEAVGYVDWNNLAAANREEVREGMEVATLQGQEAIVQLSSGSRVALNPDSVVRLEDESHVRLLKGSIRVEAQLAEEPLVVLSDAGRLLGDQGRLTLQIENGVMELQLDEGEWHFIGQRLVREMLPGDHVKHRIGSNELRFEREPSRRTLALATGSIYAPDSLY